MGVGVILLIIIEIGVRLSNRGISVLPAKMLLGDYRLCRLYRIFSNIITNIIIIESKCSAISRNTLFALPVVSHRSVVLRGHCVGHLDNHST